MSGIIRERKNCWKTARASRAAFLVYASSYHQAFYRAAVKARETVYILGWKSPRRVRFRRDSNHHLGSSLHQKIVVIDDSVAFSGGIDLTARRWDTPEHRPGRPRITCRWSPRSAWWRYDGAVLAGLPGGGDRLAARGPMLGLPGRHGVLPDALGMAAGLGLGYLILF